MGVFLVTGAAGFIGFHLSKYLLERGDKVIGIDNLSNYYDVALKQARLSKIQEKNNFHFHKLDVANKQEMLELFTHYQPEKVAHLAAQAGVRYSVKNPYAYVDSNIMGFMNILENCRYSQVEHLVFASSSSVYGANKKMPFSVHDNVDHPLSLYAATKKANELMAHTYSHLFKIPATGLRFFTVYGPWGRPDMALFMFTKAILEEQSIDVFNYGQMRRDFTYIDDIVEGIVRVLDKIPHSNPEWSGYSPDPGTSSAAYKLYNIGNNKPIELGYFIEVLEECIGRKAAKNMLPPQPGDVLETYADIEDLEKDTGFKPSTPIEVGIPHFVAWYRSYYQV